MAVVYLFIYKCQSFSLIEGAPTHFTHQFALKFTSSHNLITAVEWVSHKLLQIVVPGYKVRMSCCVADSQGGWRRRGTECGGAGLHNNSNTAHGGAVGQGLCPASPAICFKCPS